MTLDSSRIHMRLILEEISAGGFYLNLALHDLCKVVASPALAGATDAGRLPAR